MANLQELLNKHIGLQHERAVWSTLRSHLATYCTTDLGPPSKGIEVADNFYSMVQEGSIKQVMQEIDDRITNLSQELRAQAKLDVPKTKPAAKKVAAPKKKAAAKKT